MIQSNQIVCKEKLAKVVGSAQLKYFSVFPQKRDHRYSSQIPDSVEIFKKKNLLNLYNLNLCNCPLMF
jgi:hypothetical protein